MSHTKEPWKVDTFAGCDHADIRDTNGRRIAIVAGTYPMNIKTEDANAQRIVACVNACAGMDDPAKEIAAKDARIAELEAALKVARTVLADTRDDWKVVAGEESIVWIRVDNAEKQARAALERGGLGGIV